MSRALASLARAKGDRKKERLPDDERRALEKTKAEAKRAGASLSNPGGGLRPSLVLGVFRRDGWRCKRCGGRENLGVHHKGGLKNPVSVWLQRKGRCNVMNNIVTLCEKKLDGGPGCHDAVHEEDRARAL